MRRENKVQKCSGSAVDFPVVLIQSKWRYFSYCYQKLGSLPFHVGLSPRDRPASHPGGSTNTPYRLMLYWNQRQTPAWWATWLVCRFYLFYHGLFCSRFFFSFFSIHLPLPGSKQTRQLHGWANNGIVMDTAVLRAPIRKRSLEFGLHNAHLVFLSGILLVRTKSIISLDSRSTLLINTQLFRERLSYYKSVKVDHDNVESYYR